jgi:formylmethanofuran dehydrogenase subunit E-like metal-binding protein
MAADNSLHLMKKADVKPAKKNLIVMTNAGYAEVNGSETIGALDGLATATGASRGRKTLIEVHSAFWSPLWFAVYDKGSGYGVYLEIDSSVAAKMTADSKTVSPGLFAVTAMERIDVEYLYRHASDYKIKFDNKVFGGNEFRIITIANAIASGAPVCAIRSLEFHDHYCPGVTSGIFMVNYLKAHFPAGKSGYFVHTVDPWCKEDALLVLLNATPGKKSYAVSYPTDKDKEARTDEAKDSATIFYRQNMQTQKWEAVVLAFEWAETGCPETGNMLIDKLCMDLWYLERMDKPEDFVKLLKTFELPEGVSPRDWARPGVDPLRMLGMMK